MKCELCHNADAEQAIIKKEGGQEQELYVCAACALLERLAESGGKTASPGNKTKKPKKNAPPAAEDAFPELMGMLLDATLEIINHPLLSQEPVCPHCGITRSEYRKATRLGCASCYETFTLELANLIADMHRVPQHTGKKPKCPMPSKHVQQLMRRLKASGFRQSLDVATLREIIRSLGWEPGTPKEEI